MRQRSRGLSFRFKLKDAHQCLIGNAEPKGMMPVQTGLNGGRPNEKIPLLSPSVRCGCNGKGKLELRLSRSVVESVDGLRTTEGSPSIEGGRSTPNYPPR